MAYIIQVNEKDPNRRVTFKTDTWYYSEDRATKRVATPLSATLFETKEAAKPILDFINSYPKCREASLIQFN